MCITFSLHLSNSIIHINKSPNLHGEKNGNYKSRRFIDTSEEHIESGSDEQIHLDLIDEDKAQEKYLTEQQKKQNLRQQR